MPDTTTSSGGTLPPPGPPPPTRPWGAPAPIAPTPAAIPARPPRRGRLTTAWRAITVVTWVGVFVAYMAVWKASEEIGIATWWLGPSGDPQPVVVRLVPFALTAVVGILASYNVPRMPVVGLVGGAVLALLAVPDLSRSTGLAVIEFAIAGAALSVSAASFTGTYRLPRSSDAG